MPEATLTAVPASGVKPNRLTGATPLTTDGKPTVLFVGGEFCPYCAAERWSLIVALSRFGTFTGLQTTSSSPTDVDPDTATFTFRNAKYTSKYLSFQSVEIADRDGKPLQTPTTEQASIVSKYDRAKYTGGQDNTIPFLYYNGQFVSDGASYDGKILRGRSQLDIARTLQKPSGTISRTILGSANTMTTALCAVTRNQPADVCGHVGTR